MLQRLLFPKSNQPILHQYLETIQTQGFQGEIHLDPGTRLVNATDNSVYQIVPQAVLIPHSAHDIVILFRTANKPPFHTVSFAARGGGTGTNGQSLHSNIIIDCSKRLNRILELNLEEGWVRVEAGVVLDQLNQFLKPHGVFFAPSLSPSNRATLGGMANTDASGKGSRVYGKTSEHILEITAVYSDGSVHTSRAVTQSELKTIQSQNDLIGAIYRTVDQIVSTHRNTIAKQFPKLKRFMTGYNLAHVYKPDTPDLFNLNAILTGSEGTLATITELTLQLTPIPKAKRLLVLPYPNFHEALRDAQNLLLHQPHAIETIDSTILTLAKTDVIYPLIAHYLETDGKQTAAINLVEFVDQSEPALDAKLNVLLASWHPNSSTAFAHTLATSEKDIAQLWTLRKHCVGLLGKEPGRRKPVSGMEDTLVPPEKLADYITEFRGLLDKAGLTYGMFGHVDVGCLHVRPSLDLSDPKDEALYYQLTEAVAHLTLRYGGLLWGEHGKGFRSEYVPLFFGTELYPELCNIKKVCDPNNQLNPGKIATPRHSGQALVSIKADKRGTFERAIDSPLQAEYALAIACNGNGACFDYNVLNTMCPSYKATRDRRHSPKGRAALLREWLRLQSVQKRTLPTPRWFNSVLKYARQYDFSHEVYDALHGCLACKACATNCPVNVDIPKMKARFLAAYHSRYLRSIRDYTLAYSERIAYQQAQHAPRVSRWLMQTSFMRALLRSIGWVDLPKLAVPSLSQRCGKEGIPMVSISSLEALSDAQRKRTVVLIQDWLTSCYEPELVIDVYHFLTQLGYQVFLLAPLENGKTWYALGFTKQFKTIAEKTSSQLQTIQRLHLPMIGIEPSVTLTYRQDYAYVLQSDTPVVHLIEEWLSQPPQIAAMHRWYNDQPKSVYLLPHCSEKATDARLMPQWQAIFEQFGITLHQLELGCCGMAGDYGLKREHQTTSRQLFDFGWRDGLQRGPCLATGFSCRTQIHRLANQTLMHPISYLYKQMQRLHMQDE